jgi:hypothetical protein
MMSASLDFYPGIPDLVPQRVIPLWNGTARYKSTGNYYRDFFVPQSVFIDPDTRAARLMITTTGHSPVGEFTPAWRTLIFAPVKGGEAASEQRFKNLLWKTDNYLNPVRPQRGTWKFSRAGWAPGEIVRPWWLELTPFIVPGATGELRYIPEPYDFSLLPVEQRPTEEEVNSAVQLVRSYLILYGSADSLLPAAAIEVLAVEAGSNAERGGIEVGDFLASYAGERPATIDELLAMIKAAEAAGKQQVRVLVYRGANQVELALGPGRMGVKIAEDASH